MANQIWTYSTRSVHSMTPSLSVRLWGRQSTILSRLSDTIALRPGLSTHYVLTHKALDGRHEVWSQLLNGESQAGRTRMRTPFVKRHTTPMSGIFAFFPLSRAWRSQ